MIRVGQAASRVDFPLVVLTVGFGFGLAANVMSTWAGGPVRILGGALASLALPAALHLWDQIPVDTRLAWWVRLVAMTLIAGGAAVTTFWHASELLIFYGETEWLARAYPVMTELMVTMGVLAHRTRPAPVVKRESAPVGEPTAPTAPVVDAAPSPAPRTSPDVEDPAWSEAQALEWALQQLHAGASVVGWRRISTASGLTEGPAGRIAKKAKQQFDAEQAVGRPHLVVNG